MVKKEEKIKDKVENLRAQMDVRDIRSSEHPSFHIPRTFGQRSADNLAKWAGSWVFIISFLVLLGFWIAANAYLMIQYNLGKPFDPFPFILLNLILSMLAAIQAPIILMSQNRQGQKDRFRAQIDFDINKKAEAEIREVKKQLNKIESILTNKKK